MPLERYEHLECEANAHIDPNHVHTHHVSVSKRDIVRGTVKKLLDEELIE